jgi:cytochrome P450 family 135
MGSEKQGAQTSRDDGSLRRVTGEATRVAGGGGRAAQRALAVRDGLPPGPRTPMPLQTLAAIFAATWLNKFMRRRYGPIVALRIAGLGKVVLVSDASLAKEVLTGDPDMLRGGAGNERFLTRPAGPRPVTVLDGEEHLRMRRLLLPAFRSDALAGYSRMIRDLAGAQIRHWPADRPVQTRRLLQQITLEVILRVLVGLRDEQQLREWRSAAA